MSRKVTLGILLFPVLIIGATLALVSWAAGELSDRLRAWLERMES